MRPAIPLCACLLAAVAIGNPSASGHGDLHEAIEGVTRIIEDSPPEASLFLRRAELHRLHEDWVEAEKDYRRALELEPEHGGASLGFARLRLAQHREEDALQWLDRFISAHPDDPEGRLLRARVLDRRGKWNRAEADLEAAVASSTEPHYVSALAEMLVSHGHPDEAVRALDKASRAHGFPPSLEQKALELEEGAGRTEAALQRLDRLIARESRSDIWLARKARLLTSAGRPDEALETWGLAAAAFEAVPAEKRALDINRRLAEEIARGLNPLATENR